MEQYIIVTSGTELRIDSIAINYSPYLSTLFNTRMNINRDEEDNIIFDEFGLDDMQRYINYLECGATNGLNLELMNYMGHEGDYFIQWIRDHKNIRDLSLTHDIRREHVKVDERFIGMNYVYDDKYIFYSHTPQDIIDRLTQLNIRYLYDIGSNVVYMKRYSTIQTTMYYPYLTHKNCRGRLGIVGPEGVSLNPFNKDQCIPLYCSNSSSIIDLILDGEIKNHTIIHRNK